MPVTWKKLINVLYRCVMRPEQWAGTNIIHIGSYAKKDPRNVQMWEKQGLFKFLFISCIGIQMLTIFVNFRISTSIPKAEFEI